MTSATEPVEVTTDPTYGELVWSQFRKRGLAMASLFGVLFLVAVAVYAPLFVSDKPFIWVTAEGAQSPWLGSLFDRNFFESTLDIFFNVLMVTSLATVPIVGATYWMSRDLGRHGRKKWRSRGLLAAIAIILVVFSAVTVFPTKNPKVVYDRVEQSLIDKGEEVTAVYPVLPYSFRKVNVRETLEPISLRHPLGTDKAGRDVAARMIYGTRISLTIGVFAVAIYITVGIIVGGIAGFYGGRVDVAIQRLIEIVMCIPSFFLILTVAAFIPDRSIFHIMFIIAAVRWTGPARLVRAEFLRLRKLDFVAAAEAAGYRTPWIIFREILPNAIGPVLVSATFGVASAILLESSISFLGLGDITVPSWGQILSAGRTTGNWILILAPGFAIFITVSLLNLMGEGFRDALDPKMRK